MRVYHGTSAASADAIASEGVRIDRSDGGYYGRAFYVTADRDLALSNYAGFQDEGAPTGVVLEFDLAVDHVGVLDLSDPIDWERWQPISNSIARPDFAATAVRRGILAVRDEGSIGGWAVYCPGVLRRVTS